MARRPISYQLRKVSTRDKQLDIAKEWAQQWHDDAVRLIRKLNDTAGHDWDAFDDARQELLTLIHRKCDALPNIFDILAAPTKSDLKKQEAQDAV